MKPGDVIITSHIRSYFWPAQGWAGYKAEKDEAFVFIFLGTEPRDGSKPLNPLMRLEELGWRMTDKLKNPLESDPDEFSGEGVA